MNSVGTFISEAEQHDWRCVCILRPLLGRYSDLGGIYVRITGRHAHPVHYIYDLRNGAVLAHCGSSCHAWRALALDKETGCVIDYEYQGPRPAISCPCMKE